MSVETPTRRSWRAMRTRCLNSTRPDFRNYGGRGITMCERWKIFENFLADMGERPEGAQIGRINNDGNYEPGNCRWESRLTNSNNRRTSRLIEFQGRTQSITEWARELGVPNDSLFRRLNRDGWSIERALSKPLKRHNSGATR